MSDLQRTVRERCYRVVRDRMDRNDIARSYTQRFISAYFGSRTETLEWERAKHNLVRLRDAARTHSAELAIVVYPVLVQLNDDYPFTEICDLLVEYAESIDVPVHNLLPYFLGQNAAELWVSSWDQHPNAEGHRLTADALEPFLADLLAP